MKKFIYDIAEVGKDLFYAVHWLLSAGIELSCIIAGRVAVLYRTRPRITILKVADIGVVRDVIEENNPGIGK
ncbi:MAG: hypothetical protein Q4D26_12205 [Clostridia bacterium]|nr:hypothetical protein [Clostridia bacterium]MDO4302133.1 hypothetical protein [Clostridia bacterium]